MCVCDLWGGHKTYHLPAGYLPKPGQNKESANPINGVLGEQPAAQTVRL